MPNERGHITPPPTGVPPRRQAFDDLSLSINDIVPVTNITDRAQTVTKLTAKGAGPSPARPLHVYRQDAPAGARHEYTEDGQTWAVIPSHAAPPATLPLPTGWEPMNGFARPRLLIDGIRRTLLGGMVQRQTPASLAQNSTYVLMNAGTIPDGSRPAVTEGRSYAGLWNATSIVSAQVRVQPDGSVVYIPAGAISLTVGTPATGYIQIPDITWTV